MMGSKRNRVDSSNESPAKNRKKVNRGFEKWSLSVVTPARTRFDRASEKRKTKSLDEDLLCPPLTPLIVRYTNNLDVELSDLSINSSRKKTIEFNAPDSSNPVFQLPELLHRIFSYLEPESLNQCSKVNNTWEAIASTIINRDLVIQDGNFSDCSLDSSNNGSCILINCSCCLIL